MLIHVCIGWVHVAEVEYANFATVSGFCSYYLTVHIETITLRLLPGITQRSCPCTTLRLLSRHYPTVLPLYHPTVLRLLPIDQRHISPVAELLSGVKNWETFTPNGSTVGIIYSHFFYR